MGGRIVLAGCLCLSLLAPTTRAEPARVVLQKQQQASLRFQGDRVVGQIVELGLSSVAELTLSIEGAPPITLGLKQKDGTIQDAKDDQVLVAQRLKLTTSGAWKSCADKVTRKLQPDSTQRWELSMSLDPFAEPKEYQVLLDPLIYRTNTSNDWQQIHWQPFTVRITTTVQNPDKPSLSELKEIQVPEAPLYSGKSPLFWVFAGLGALLLLASLLAFLGLFVKNKLRERRLSPGDWALEQLHKLHAQNYPAQGKAEAFHTHLSQVLREYLERRFRLRAPQQTTAEFLLTMQSWPLLPASQQQLLRELLERCDVVKFAPVSASAEECAQLASMARAFIEQSAQVPTPTASTATP